MGKVDCLEKSGALEVGTCKEATAIVHKREERVLGPKQ